MVPVYSPGLIDLRLIVAYTEFPLILVPKASARTPVIIIKTRICGGLIWVCVSGPCVYCGGFFICCGTVSEVSAVSDGWARV